MRMKTISPALTLIMALASAVQADGARTSAALFLQEFVAAGIAWAHLDVMAWNGSSRPGRPEGGEAMALRALFAVVAERFPAQITS